jgi:peptidylprolyl isomerase
MKTRYTFALACATGLALASCGGSTDDGQQGWADADCASLEASVNVAAPPESATISGAIAVAGDPDLAPNVFIQGDAAPVATLETVDLVEGVGEPVPPGASVTVEYCGVGLTSRNIFDSSWARGEPATFPLSGVITGWQEGIPGMKPGGRRLLVIPGDLAYGPNPPSPDILPDETLIFVVDMIADNTPQPINEKWAISSCDVLEAPVGDGEPAPDSRVEGAVAVAGVIDRAPTVSIEKDAIPATELVTVDLQDGTGEAASVDSTITVEYCGLGLTTRRIFDSSWARGEPATFPLSGVITGWQEGIPGMKPGGRRLLVIPGDLAYGPNPPSPDILPDETLVFVVDLISIEEE